MNPVTSALNCLRIELAFEVRVALIDHGAFVFTGFFFLTGGRWMPARWHAYIRSGLSGDFASGIQLSCTGMNTTMIKLGRFLSIIPALIFSLTTFAADTRDVGNSNQPAASVEKSGSTRKQLEELLNAYQGLLTNKNVDAILELYSADPVFMPEYAPPAVGREAVRKAYEWVFATLNLEGKFIFHEAEVIGDSAWVRTNSTGRLTVIATGAKADVANSEFFLFKREDGAWKIHRYIFTASAPPPQAK